MPWGEIPFTRPDEPWHIAEWRARRPSLPYCNPRPSPRPPSHVVAPWEAGAQREVASVEQARGMRDRSPRLLQGFSLALLTFCYPESGDGLRRHSCVARTHVASADARPPLLLRVRLV